MNIVKRQIKHVLMVERCPIKDPQLPVDIELTRCSVCHYNKGKTDKEQILCSNVQRWEE